MLLVWSGVGIRELEVLDRIMNDTIIILKTDNAHLTAIFAAEMAEYG